MGKELGEEGNCGQGGRMELGEANLELGNGIGIGGKARIGKGFGGMGIGEKIGDKIGGN